jgi:hypothetical protein
MHRFRLAMVLLIVLWGGVATASNRRSLKMPGVQEHFDLRYLPEHRYTGATGDRGDTEMTLDLYIPAGRGPFPMVMYVHGGSYSGGSKYVGSSNKDLVKNLLKQGFAVASLNYILRPKGIFPQVWYDYRDSMRFLRKESARFRLDPLRFGVYGISAGGWLVSSATVGNGDLLYAGYRLVSCAELKKQNWRYRVRDPLEHKAWLRPMRNPQPSWPGIHGGVTAVAFDFSHHMNEVKPWNPAYQDWIGKGYTPKYMKKMPEDGGRSRIQFAEMTGKKHRGRNVHVPPFYGKRDESTALAADGSEKPLGDVVIDFYKKHLIEDYRLPAPEIYPVPRCFAGRTEVSMVAPPGTTIHFTVDGSQPTARSPAYSRPFTITRDTVVKAITVRNGLADSGVNVAQFVQGHQPPQITGPEELPPATTGQRYEFTFTSNARDTRWLIQGELVPHVPWKKQNMVYPNNMVLNALTGHWSGTPHNPGVYWIQVWVNNGPGTVASHRDYRWVVRGRELPGASWSAQASKSDQNVELARLVHDGGWSGKYWLNPLVAELNVRGVRFLLMGDKKEDRTLIVDKRDLKDAVAALRAAVDQNQKRLQSKTQWLHDGR